MTAFIYVRVSSADQVRGFSLDTQEAACRAFCDREAWTVAALFREEGESAKTTDRRELQKLLALIARPGHGVTHLVVYDLSRFTRQGEDHVRLKAILRHAGVRLVSITQQLDETPTGEFVEWMFAGINQLDNAQRKEKALAGMKEAFRRGVWAWLPPIGYLTGRRGGPSLEPDPLRAPLVRMAFEFMAPGTSTQQEVRARVTRAGLRGLRAPLSRETFSHMLHNPIYCGRMVAPRWGVEARGNFEPIISERLFDQVQAALAREASGWTRTEHVEEFPLRYWTRCLSHDRPLTAYRARGRNGTRYPYYRCTAPAACLNERREAVDERFRGFLAGLACPPAVWAFWEATLREAWTTRHEAQKSETSILVNRIAALDAKLGRLLAHLLNGTIDEATYGREQVAITRERNQARQALSLVSVLPPLEPALEAGRELLQRPVQTWDAVIRGQGHAFVRIVFPGQLSFGPEAGFRTIGKSLYLNHLTAAGAVTREDWPPIEDGFRTSDPGFIFKSFIAARQLLELPWNHSLN